MRELLFASLAADNAAPFYRLVAAELSQALRRPVRLLEDIPWQEQEQWLWRGEAQLGVVCGSQYVMAADRLQLLAAPVMRGRRYLNQPVYFSDLVVRSDSHIEAFDQLRGARWAYNEPTSHSGYGIVAHALAERGLSWSFFDAVVESGSHERSQALVLTGDVDAAAIDSTVLETELSHDTALGSRLRVIETLGPSPAPPLVASRQLPEDVRRACLQALLAVPPLGEVTRFERMTDADYDPIRAMWLRGRGSFSFELAAAKLD